MPIGSTARVARDGCSALIQAPARASTLSVQRERSNLKCTAIRAFRDSWEFDPGHSHAV